MANFVLSLHSGGNGFDNVGFSLLGGLHVYGYEFSKLLRFSRFMNMKF